LRYRRQSSLGVDLSDCDQEQVFRTQLGDYPTLHCLEGEGILRSTGFEISVSASQCHVGWSILHTA
jgi:hypothetical protein